MTGKQISHVWIRCVFESLNDRPNQIIAVSAESLCLDNTLTFQSPQKGPNPFESRPNAISYGYDMDVKFLKEDLIEGTVVKIIQAKLFRVEDYYQNATDATDKRSQGKQDHIRILEIDTMGFKLNFINKGGNTILSDYTSDNFKRHC